MSGAYKTKGKETTNRCFLWVQANDSDTLYMTW